jgi:hypothetical protein
MQRKIRLVLLLFASSYWFFPISVGGGTLLGIEILCVAEHCSKDIEHGDAAPPSFVVLVESSKPSAGPIEVPLKELEAYLTEHPGYSATLKSAKGISADGTWEFAVENAPTGQLIEIRNSDDTHIVERYLVANESVTPLRSKSTNPGYAFSALLAALLIAHLIRWLALRSLIGRPTPTNLDRPE